MNNRIIIRVATIDSGSVTGGFGSMMAGGKFMDGFKHSLISSALNHAGHMAEQEIFNAGEPDEAKAAQKEAKAQRDAHYRERMQSGNEDKFKLWLNWRLKAYDIDFWVQQNGGKVLVPLALSNPLVGVPNDVSILFTGYDMGGNPFTTFDRVVAGAGVLSFGTARGVFSVSNTVRTWAKWGNYGTTGYSIGMGWYNNYK